VLLLGADRIENTVSLLLLPLFVLLLPGNALLKSVTVYYEAVRIPSEFAERPEDPLL
jgi:hypothetical protein